MTIDSRPWRPAGLWRVVGLALLWAGCVPLAAVASTVADRIHQARSLAQRDPRQALKVAQALRVDALARQDLASRLAVDELSCRVLSDLDAKQGLDIAQAGIDAAGARPPQEARPAWLRLRACRAGLLFDLGQIDMGRSEVDALVASTDPEAESAARGLGLLERGLFRSRSGELAPAQRDLLAACALLKGTEEPADHDLCLYHLSSHYRRAGDTDEALALLRQLHARAHAQGAVYDDSVYVFAMARALASQQRWSEALQGFREVLAFYVQLQDHSGVAYAEHGIADCLLRLQRAAEALPHARRAQSMVALDADPHEVATRSITLAEALVAQGQVAQALAVLNPMSDFAKGSGRRPTLAAWLRVRAQAARSQERWKEAFEALSQAREIEQELHREQLSEQSARLRLQFNRAHDEEELVTLRTLNEQGQRLRQTQAVALGLFVVLLLAAAATVVRKVRQARRLQALASTDELTGLANRRAVLAFAQQELDKARTAKAPLAVLISDVDFFKRINDTHGHAVGDEVLRHVSRVLSASLRGQDRLGRVGGEEFIGVLPNAGLQVAAQVAERMRSAVESTPATSTTAGAVNFTISIGVADLAEGESIEALIARADAALYRAKHEGRNRVCFADRLAPVSPVAPGPDAATAPASPGCAPSIGPAGRAA